MADAQPPGSDPPLPNLIEVMITDQTTNQPISDASITFKGIRADGTAGYDITHGPCIGGAVFSCVRNGRYVGGGFPPNGGNLPLRVTTVKVEAPGYVTRVYTLTVLSPTNLVQAQLSPGLDVRLQIGTLPNTTGEVPLQVEIIGRRALDGDTTLLVTLIYTADGPTGSYVMTAVTHRPWEQGRTRDVLDTFIKVREPAPPGGRHGLEVIVTDAVKPGYVLGRSSLAATQLP